MSFLDKLKPSNNPVGRFFQGVPGNIQRPVNDMVQNILRKGEEIGNTLTGLGEEIKKKLYDTQGKIAINIRGEADKGVEKVRGFAGTVENTGKKAIGDIEGLGKKVLADIENGSKKALGDIESKGGAVVKDIEEKGKQAVVVVEEEIKKVLHHIQEDFKSGAAKRAMKLLYAIASDDDNPVKGFGGTVSVIGYDVDNPAGKLQTIKKYVDNPPTDFDGTIAMLQELDVAEVTVTVSGEIFTSAVSFSFWVRLDIVDAVPWFAKFEDHAKEAMKV